MNDLETLIATALIGTERQPLPELSLAPRLQTDSKEEALLGAAALISAYRRAAFNPTQGQTTLEPSPPDAKPEMTAKIHDLLHRILADHQLLLEEYLSLLVGYRFTHRDLPTMLDYGRNNAAFRARIAELLDARGRWLASLNSAWSWATSNTESLEDAVVSFETGSKSARSLALQHIRQQDPHRARVLLEGSWKQEAANERKEFISVLHTNLSDADEAFLEHALADRSSDVRAQAADLLAQLPRSAFNARNAQRLRGILKVKREKAGLLKTLLEGKPAKLEIELPETFDPDWARDGIQEKAPQGVGQKQFWVRQMLERTRLDTLQDITGMDALELLKNTHKDWQDFIRRAVMAALEQQPTAELVKALIAYDFTLLQNSDALSVLAPDTLESLVRQRVLARTDADTHLLDACKHTWSEGFWHDTLEWIALRFARIQRGEAQNTYLNFSEVVIRQTPVAWIPRALNGHASLPNWMAMLSSYRDPPSEKIKHPWYWQHAQQQFQSVLGALQVKLEMYQVPEIQKETR